MAGSHGVRYTQQPEGGIKDTVETGGHAVACMVACKTRLGKGK